MADLPSRAELDDRSLLRAHVAGDEEAFGVLFSRHRERLWAIALRTTGDREEAADALQDAMTSAFRRAESFRGDSAVTTWLHRIVVNACLDRHRRSVVRRADPLPEDLDRVAPRGGPDPISPAAPEDPADAAVRADRARAVSAALATLPMEQRAALVMVDMQGLSVEETATALGVPPGTVKSRCSRGRAKLLPLLREALAESPPGNQEPSTRVLPTSPESPAGGEQP